MGKGLDLAPDKGIGAITRRDFLKLGGVGLTGAVLHGAVLRAGHHGPDTAPGDRDTGAGGRREGLHLHAYYKNPELDDILRQGATTVDENERRRLYERAQEIIYNDAPWVPIEYAEVPLGYQASVEGITPNPVGNEEFTAVRLGSEGA